MQVQFAIKFVDVFSQFLLAKACSQAMTHVDIYKKNGVSFACACPVIDHEFRHNIFKVAVDPRGDSQADQFGFLTDINLFFYDDKLSVRSRSLPQKLEIHVPVRLLTKKLANERAKICAVIVN